VSGRVSDRLASGLGASFRRDRPAIKESGQTDLIVTHFASQMSGIHVWLDSGLLCELYGDKHCVKCRN
jgi:hypothetical protein